MREETATLEQNIEFSFSTLWDTINKFKVSNLVYVEDWVGYF